MTKLIDHKDLKPILDHHLTFIKENATDWIYRCPYCGDSKNPAHGHLYIGKSLEWYHCFKCGKSGHIDNLLRDLGSEYRLKDGYNDKGKHYDLEYENYKKIKTSKIPETWVKYLINRFNITEEVLSDIVKYLSLLDINSLKNVKIYNATEEKAEEYKQEIISGKIISFVTHLKSLIQGRYITDNEGLRYITLKINKIPTRDMYVVKDNSDRNHEITTAFISEGIFDAIGLFLYNKDKFDPKHTIYVAALGDSLFSGLKFIDSNFRCKGKVDVHFFLDNDQNLNLFLNRLSSRLEKNRSDYSNYDFSLYINMSGKDTGQNKINPLLLKKI